MATSSREAPAFVRLAAHPLRWRLLAELGAGDLRVRELVTLVGEPQNLVSYHLRLLREGGLVTATRSSFDGRDSYYHLDLDRCSAELAATGAALHPALRHEPGPRRVPGLRLLFVCTGNSARSPIAEALLCRRTGGRVTAASAGTRPRPRVHPLAVRVLREEFGVDIADRHPRPLAAVPGRFDYVISLCDKAREECPDLPGSPRRMHWSVPDPAVSARPSYAAFRQTAAGIDTRIRHLLPALAASHS